MTSPVREGPLTLRPGWVDFTSISPAVIVIPFTPEARSSIVSGLIHHSNTRALSCSNELTRPDGGLTLAPSSSSTFATSVIDSWKLLDYRDVGKKHKAPESPQSVKHHCFPPWKLLKEMLRSKHR